MLFYLKLFFSEILNFLSLAYRAARLES